MGLGSTMLMGSSAHLQTFKAHVKLALMEGDCDCIGQFSSS